MSQEFQIQRIPRGLLDLLGLRGYGDTPHLLGQNLVGTVDLSPLYLLDRQETIITNTNNLAGVGFYQTAAIGEVPEGEMWILSNVTALSNALAAGNIIRGRIAIQRQAAGNWDASAVESRETTTGAQWLLGWDVVKYLRAKDRLGVYIAEVTGYAASITVCATIYRVRV